MEDVDALLFRQLLAEDAGDGRLWADVLAFDWETEWQDAMLFQPVPGWAAPLRLLTEQLAGTADVTGWRLEDATRLRLLLDDDDVTRQLPSLTSVPADAAAAPAAGESAEAPG